VREFLGNLKLFNLEKMIFEFSLCCETLLSKMEESNASIKIIHRITLINFTTE